MKYLNFNLCDSEFSHLPRHLNTFMKIAYRPQKLFKVKGHLRFFVYSRILDKNNQLILVGHFFYLGRNLQFYSQNFHFCDGKFFNFKSFKKNKIEIKNKKFQNLHFELSYSLVLVLATLL